MTTDGGHTRLKPSAVKIVVDQVAKQFNMLTVHKGKKRQWGSMIMIKTRELSRL